MEFHDQIWSRMLGAGAMAPGVGARMGTNDVIGAAPWSDHDPTTDETLRDPWPGQPVPVRPSMRPPQDAEAFTIAGLSYEAFASNLGVLDMGTPQPVRLVAIWGPAILGQIQGELSAGICTFNGQLRIVYASHDPFPDYLDRVHDVLDTAC
jgi:hypothetical protein